MTSQLKKPRDVVSGAVVVAIGAAFLFFGRGLTTGTAFRMGPGYFPLVLSVLMIGLGGLIMLLASFAPTENDELKRVPWRGISLVIGTVVFFGMALDGLGLPITLAIAVFTTAWASRFATWRASILLALGLTAVCTVVFIYGLGISVPVVGDWLSADYWAAPVPSAP